MNYFNKESKNALTIAFENNNRNLVQILISNGAKFDCQHGYRLLWKNCKKSEMNDFKLLMDNGAFKNSFHSEYDQMTPLMEAARCGFTEKVRLILQCVDPSMKSWYINKRNKNGLTALHLACMNNHQEVAKLLIEHGAGVNHSTLHLC